MKQKRKTLENVLDKNNIVLVGDLNGKSLEWGNLTTDKHGEIMEGILSKNNMIVHNDGQPTMCGKSSVIDLIITSATLSSTVASCDTLTYEIVRSDHIAILTDLAIDKKNDVYGTRSSKAKAIHFSWLGRELSSVAWSTGAQLIIFFCFRFSVVLFDRPGISISHATHCICRVLVFASS